MKRKLVAMVVGKLEPLRAGSGCLSGNDIALAIAVLGPDGKPRNYRVESDDPESCPGGCSARVFRSDSSGDPLWSCYGPDISFGDEEQYRRAFQAVKRIRTKMDLFYLARGPVADSAEAFGRWLEACGVDCVMVRAPGSTHEDWLTHGEWDSMAAGAFVGRVRQLCRMETKEGVAA